MYHGFLGTSASIMLDVVVVSLAAVVPTLLYSIYLAKWKKNYVLHRKVQLALGVVLGVVVLLFEVDMRLQGGFWVMAKDSIHADSAFLKYLLYVHLCFSVSTVFIWIFTYVTALRSFPNPPVPSKFSPRHRLLARISVADMVGTVVTGLMVYYFGFITTV